MTEDAATLKASFFQALEASSDIQSLEAVRVSFLGKKGSLTAAMKALKDLPPEERKSQGQALNQLRDELVSSLEAKREGLQAAEWSEKEKLDAVDPGLPGRKHAVGQLHPLTQVEDEVLRIFRSLGFALADGPEVEDDHYNFQCLNFPDDHPARDMQDTLFLKNGLLLRTHTSPVQIRTMEKHPPPIKILAPGRVYRHDSDATHSPVFHQIEGLCAAPGIHFGHLKGCLEHFVTEFFAPGIKTRFRPSFFPFTEPSAEMDIEWQGGWMEVLGCGMVDPNVFESINKVYQARGETSPYASKDMSGFAFGIGIERLAMLKYKIPNIRLFFENDVRFLSQFH